MPLTQGFLQCTLLNESFDFTLIRNSPDDKFSSQSLLRLEIEVYTLHSYSYKKHYSYENCSSNKRESSSNESLFPRELYTGVENIRIISRVASRPALTRSARRNESAPCM